MEKNEAVKMVLVGLFSAFFGAVFVWCYFLFWVPQHEDGGDDLTNPIGDGSMCSKDAKLCPDGSAVGRIGPNCEFAPCPGEENGNIFPGKKIPEIPSLCVDSCGDGTCQEGVCMGQGCPCVESEAICPSDCSSSAGNDFPKEAWCPEDVKICPNGAAVIRIGPNCEFAPCP